MKSRKKGTLSYIILDILEKSVDGYIRLEDFTYKSHLYAYGGRWSQALPKSELSRAINRLKLAGLVEKSDINGELIVKLTQLGGELTSGFEAKNWDGKWRIVIFDIPESKRLVRDLFRRNLKKWGFRHLQKSVWVSKRDVYDKLVSYIKDLKIDSWVIVIESDRLSSTNNLHDR